MERKPPTHVLTIKVPLDLSQGQSFTYDPGPHGVHMALNVIMHATRLAVDGVLCGGVDVALEKQGDQ